MPICCDRIVYRICRCGRHASSKHDRRWPSVGVSLVLAGVSDGVSNGVSKLFSNNVMQEYVELASHVYTCVCYNCAPFDAGRNIGNSQTFDLSKWGGSMALGHLSNAMPESHVLVASLEQNNTVKGGDAIWAWGVN